LKNAKIAQTPGSITGRLTLLYTLSASALLVVVTAFLYETLVINLREEDKQFLADEVHTLQMLIKEHGDNRASLEQEVQWEAVTGNVMPYYAYFSRILDSQGSVVMIETPGMAEIIPASVFPSPAAETERNHLAESSLLWRKADGHPYLLVVAQAADDAGESRVIQVALDVSREDALLSGYQRKLAIVLPLGVLLSATLGALVARRGMRPLQDITFTAQRISASRLHERIEPARWPRELRTLAEAFDQMLGRLEDSFTRLTQFSADLAHELRTPINNLMGEAEVALSRKRPEAEYRDVLESSLEECGRLSRMIDSLLFLARADNAQVPLQLSRLDVRSELEAIREFHDAVAEEQSVTVICEGEASLEADPLLFRRALTNLLANAIRHTPAGGRVKLVVEFSAGADSVDIRVSDSGCGIAAEHLPKVFDRFYRVDQARSADSHSTGLGLSIVKSIMAMHGGTVSIQSQPGKGATVILHFPLHPRPRLN
jgi:two-component system heavy metal sensor histidine kinase CusS